MKKPFSVILTICVLTVCLLTSCTGKMQDKGEEPGKDTQVSSESEGAADRVDSELTDIPADLEEGINTITVTSCEGSDQCWAFEGQTLIFSGITEDTVCSLSGTLDGRIVVNCPEEYKLELELCGVTLYCSTQSPITVLSGDEVTLTAKKDSRNFIYDTREALSEDDESDHAAAIWADCDLELGGKGELTVISSHNNGIHTKDDLQVKNLTLSVTCEDNALKGNDSVEITGGVLTLIAKTGDGIKTVNTDISTKGKQRGSVSLSGGTVTVYAACDGIDAAYDVIVSDEAAVRIDTDRYSPYSENVETTTQDNQRYIRFTSNQYSYSVKYYNSDSDYRWVNAVYYKSVSGGRSTYYYYAIENLTGYDKVQFFVYSSGQTQGQENNYAVKSDYMEWNTAYDTFAIEQRGTSLSYNWTNYTTSVGGGMGGPGGMGGMMDGNSEKGDYSTKGMKAGNEISVSGGTVEIRSYDDALHAGGATALENGNTSTGNVTVSGGTLTLFSKDDGIHADGTLNVTGGDITITGSYEGLEGTTVKISDGNISVVSSDDGINATATAGTGITIEGGTVYIYAGGDGIDANSRTSYQGIVFAGGSVTVISTSGGNSSIDTEQGYTYTGGSVLALCPANGMGSESVKCQNFSSIGCKTTMTVKSGQTLNVKVSGKTVVSAEMPCNLSALVIYLGSNAASFSAE